MSRTAAQKAQHATEMAAATHKIATADVAVDTVNPGTEHKESMTVDEPESVQYVLDPQMVQQAIVNRNARLVATMVQENAMMEVALEQERRAHGETRTKMLALQQIVDELTGGDDAD